MALVGVITNEGKRNLLNVAFGLGGNAFTKMAFGKGSEAPVAESTGLNAECSIADGNYSRVDLVSIQDEVEFMIKSEGVLPTTNITNSTIIKEIGIVDRDTLGEGVFWCICQVDDTEKDSSKQVKFTIYSIML
jgi:hypothetical protein